MPSIGNSDHDIVLFDTTISASRPKPPRRKIFLLKKADLQGIKDDLSDLSNIINMNDSSIEDSWKGVQYQIRKANKRFLVDTVSHDFKDNSKKFWALVKSKGQESTGVAPLKNKDGFLQSGNAARANILNDQFVSAFTRENTTNIPDMGQSGLPSMPNISVDWKGVHKLLMNLKTKKATGPDELPAIILKAAATELAPALAKLFQLSLNLGEVPQDWRNASVVPLFKKGDRHQASN
ncbi:uncharacterized protein LOC128221604 [Mya arenaria]|uniref:uncharacterized protein LOC128221604 n=1 Tax=Mya arenaria TaxID=6604 RepID=UPI0022E3E71B|nr:uncharacterized protein LOC128221604 [Mya arenaria]